MFVRGASEKASELAEDLIVKGFKFEDLEGIIKENFNCNNEKEFNYFEDILLSKIERKSKYIEVVDIKTNCKYCYSTIKELSNDTGLTVTTLNASAYGGHLANGVLKIEIKYFKTSELAEDKTEMFKARLGKIKARDYYTKSGKYMLSKLKVTDTETNTTVIYETGRKFINEFNMPIYNLSKYILHGYKFKGRYKIEVV